MTEAKPITQSWTMRFNAALATLGVLLEFLPDIAEALSDPQAGDALRNLIGDHWTGKLLALAVVGNIVLRKRTKGPVQ